jgi:hypothetical protein
VYVFDPREYGKVRESASNVAAGSFYVLPHPWWLRGLMTGRCANQRARSGVASRGKLQRQLVTHWHLAHPGWLHGQFVLVVQAVRRLVTTAANSWTLIDAGCLLSLCDAYGHLLSCRAPTASTRRVPTGPDSFWRRWVTCATSCAQQAATCSCALGHQVGG